MHTLVSASLVAAAEDYQRYWWRHDVRAQMAERVFLTKDVATDFDGFTPEEIGRLPIYQEFLVPHGIGWSAATPLFLGPGSRTMLSLHRSMSKHPFEEEELPRIKSFALHVELSLRISRELAEARLGGETLLDILSRLGSAVLLVDGQMRIVHQNEEGSALLLAEAGSFENFLLNKGELKQAIQQSLQGGCRVQAVPLTAHDGRMLVAYVLPVAQRQALSFEAIIAGPLVAIVVPSQETDEGVDTRLLMQLFGLTPGEARVANLVGSGLKPGDAALVLGVGLETVRSVLKRVFLKIGISRQSALAELMTRLSARAPR